MQQAWICDAVRTPFGRYGGALAAVRADDLGAAPSKALVQLNGASMVGHRRRCLRHRQPGG